jgi:hypothetical protein
MQHASNHLLCGSVLKPTPSTLHAQTRLLALELSDELFARSKAFRALLAPRFSAFLDATIGFRAEKPLPPPAAAATALRARALEILERWEEGFAAFYPEVGSPAVSIAAC